MTTVVAHETMDVSTTRHESPVEAELYFLIAKFLAAGPHKATAEVLRQELESSNTLPKRLDWLGNKHEQSFEELERKYPHVTPNYLLEICRRIGPILDKEIPPSVPGIRSLLGAGRQSLLRISEGTPTVRNDVVLHGFRRGGRPVTDPVGYNKPHNIVRILQGRENGGPIVRRLAVTPQIYSKQQLFFRRLGHLSAVYCLLFDRTGRHVITGADDLLVKIWSAVDGRLLMSLRGASAEITDIAVNQENTLLAAGSIDKIIRVWCLQTTRPVAVLLCHTGMITAVHFCPLTRDDLMYLVSTSTDGSVAFWNYSRLNNNKYVFQTKPIQFNERMRPGQAQMICASFSPGGMFLAAGSADHYVRVYMMLGDEGPHRILETEAHGDRVDSIQWANRGLRFISGSKDGTANIWKFEQQQWTSMKLLMTGRLPGSTIPVDTKLKAKVTMVSWDITDEWVITAVNDHSLKVWNSHTGTLVQELSGHRDEVFVLESHPIDPHVLMSAGHDGQIFIWDIISGVVIKKYENTLEGQGHGSVFDAKWSPDGMMIAATDSHGHILMFNFGSPSEKIRQVPRELFFHTDYRPVMRDSNFYVLDEQTQMAPHLMPPPFLVDVDGNPYPPAQQRLVPGRESCHGDQLVPNILVNPGGRTEVIEGLPSNEPRSHINEMIAALAQRQYGESTHHVHHSSPRATHRVGMRRDGDVEGVRQSSGNWQREGLSFHKRRVLPPVDIRTLHSVLKTLNAVAEFEIDIYHRELYRPPPKVPTMQPKMRMLKRGTKHGYRTRAAREEEVANAEEVLSSSNSSAVETDGDDSTAREEDLGSSSDSSDSSSEYSDWIADAGVNLEPPKRCKRRPAPKRAVTPDSDRPVKVSSYQPLRLDELPEAYKPTEWLSEVIPRKAPYYPQMGDEVVYFRQGHQLYLNAVREKKVYDINPHSQPWSRREIRDHEYVKVIGIKYEIRPPRLCCLKLGLIDPSGKLTRETFTIKYHDMENVIDFLVLKQTYDQAVDRQWAPGDRFRCMIDDCWWMGVIESRSPANPEFPDSLFQCFQIRWDNKECERMSPWDMEPINEARMPSEVGGSVPVLSEEINAILYKPRNEEWPNCDRDSTCQRILQGLEDIMSLSIAEPFLAPVDLNQYPSYAMVVAYPIDLATIKDRFENRFYRRVAMAQFDVRFIATNAEVFNQPKSQIVKKARIVTELCLKVIRESVNLDIMTEYHQLLENYESSDSEPVEPEPGPSNTRRSNRRKPVKSRARTQAVDWRVECRELLDTIWVCEDAAAFREPVDVLENPDYHQVIDTPMDLRTIKEDLLGGNYESPMEFCKDMRLMFTNSKNYNTNKRSRIYTMTVRLSNMFEAHIRKILANWQSLMRRKEKSKSTKQTKRVSKPTRPTNRPKTRTNGVARPVVTASDDSDSEVDVIKRTPVKKPPTPRKTAAHVTNGHVKPRRRIVLSLSGSDVSSGNEWRVRPPHTSTNNKNKKRPPQTDSEDNYKPRPSTSRAKHELTSDSEDTKRPKTKPKRRTKKNKSDSDSSPKRTRVARGKYKTNSKVYSEESDSESSDSDDSTRKSRKRGQKRKVRYCESSGNSEENTRRTRGKLTNYDEQTSDSSESLDVGTGKKVISVSSRGRVRKLTARAQALLH